MSTPEQLLLPLNPAKHQTLESFADTGNALALDAVRQLAAGTGLAQGLLLVGPEACGKTHLLQAACQHIMQLGRTAIYLDLGRQPQLDGLEYLDLLALDDLHACVQSQAMQEALFHLLNRCQSLGIRLLLASRHPPAALQNCLPDLQSRLTALPQVRMRPVSDGGRETVLRQLCRQLQMDCPGSVIRHLQLHTARDLHVQVAVLLELAHVSLKQKRRPTLPLLRTILAAKRQN